MGVYAKMGTLYEVGLEALGEAILAEHLRVAAIYFAHAQTPGYSYAQDRELFHERLQQSVAFVHGSGLEHIIRLFGLPYDPAELRDTFLTWAQHRRSCHASPS